MPFDLEILTPRGAAYRGRVDSAVFPGAEGEFGVLPGHEHFATSLCPGRLRIRDPETRSATVSAGFVQVRPDRVTVLVERCEFASPGL